jgi:hypothetical protein
MNELSKIARLRPQKVLCYFPKSNKYNLKLQLCEKKKKRVVSHKKHILKVYWNKLRRKTGNNNLNTRYLLLNISYYYAGLCFLKQSLQRTGLSPFGLNGTVSGLPHSAHVISNDCLGAIPLPSFILAFFKALQSGHLTGSFSNPLS